MRTLQMLPSRFSVPSPIKVGTTWTLTRKGAVAEATDHPCKALHRLGFLLAEAR